MSNPLAVQQAVAEAIASQVEMKLARCLTCGKPVSNPYRVFDERGKVLAGCVDSAHDGQLVVPSESASWHNRTEAKRIRKSLARFTRT